MSNEIQAIPPPYKEFKYYNSHVINFEVQMTICRLEFPIDIMIDSSDLADEYYMTTYLLSNQMLMHDVPMSTHYGIPDKFHNSLIWDVIICFPVKFRDLCENSALVFTVWTSDGKPFGSCTMQIFNEFGALKSGKQKLIFYYDRCADTRIKSETKGELYDLYARYDENFIKEKKLEQYCVSQQQLNSINLGKDASSESGGGLEWLDKFTLKQIQSNLVSSRSCYDSTNQADVESTNGFISPKGKGEAMQSFTSNGSANGSANHVRNILSPEEDDLSKYCCLIIDMPVFPYPILYDEKCYPSVTPHMPALALEMLSVKGGALNEYLTESGERVFDFNVAGRQFSGQAFGYLVDWDMDSDINPCEDMYRRLAHDTIRGRGGFDPEVKPNLKEKERIDTILNAPGDHLKTEDKDLLYRFRYTLTDNKGALTKFLLSVDWSSESEIAELPSLLELWKTKAPVDVADALKLLSGGKSFQNPIIRLYAVDVLRKASDNELKMVLLQLVQALRYEQHQSNRNTFGDGSLTNAALATATSGTNEVIALDEYHEGEATAIEIERSINDLSPLGIFLVDRACNSTVVANFLYWYLKVEAANTTSPQRSMFQNVLNVFTKHLESYSPEGKIVGAQLQALDEYVANIAWCQRQARDEKGKKDSKEICMRKLLSEKNRHKIPRNLKSVPMPLDPSINMHGLNPETVFLFKSAMYPAVIDFAVKPVTDGDILKRTSGAAVTSSEPTNTSEAEAAFEKPKVLKIIVKSGDDLRQDQLVMQLVSLMDELLKKVNLDLKLLTYGILAIGPTDGIMEFVEGSMPISAVLSAHGNSLLNFLRIHNADPNGPFGIKLQTMDTFVKSCAASCVVTYILGIGDRHLDNVMLRKNGQMFHIDFGFIFGRDPKPLPPPFRFTRSMADAMGGEETEHYKRFQSYCCQAYNWLRKSANLILNLLSLMVDAGIPDLSVHADPATVLGRVEEKFRLDLTDEQAEHFFLGLIRDSLTALAPMLMEYAHQFAVARR